MENVRKSIFILLAACFLAGCGGGDGGDEGDSGTIGFISDCSGEKHCGNNGDVYTGEGIGVWSYKNQGRYDADLNISISNVTNKDITIVFTNEGNRPVSLSDDIPIDGSSGNKLRTYGKSIDTFNYIPDIIRNFEPAELIERSDGISFNQIPLYAIRSEGDTFDWNVVFGKSSTRTATATLKKQLPNVSGRTVNIWVEDSEYESGNISSTDIDDISSYIGAIYTSVVSVAGEPWGTHGKTKLIDSNQPLDIVLVNFNNDGKPWGTVGYFWSRDNYKKSIYPDSNEAVAIFVDTETYYLGDSNGKSSTLSTIAHELTHAVNFYQRFVLKGSSNRYATFLEELTAVMMQDVVAGNISYNDVKNGYINWLYQLLYERDFTDWKNDSESYDVAGSFGAFLLRQYGIDFYKTLLRESGSSLTTLDAAIKKHDSGGLAKALRNWGASLALLPSATTPKGFGYPARDNDNGFNLQAFDLSEWEYDIIRSRLPTSSPKSLASHAHFPFLRKPISYTHEEQFVVPSGVSVSIVVK